MEDKNTLAEDKNIHRSTSRVLDILQLIAANPSVYTQAQISEVLKAPKSSLFPILHTLNARHFIRQDNAGRYRIDFAAFQIGSSYLQGWNFLEDTEQILRELTAASGETSHLATLAEGNVLYLKKIDSPEQIRMTSRVGIQLPAYSTALGKAMLIDCEMSDLMKLYPDGLKPVTDNTITDMKILIQQLHDCRNKGYTYEVEESTEYIRCFAVPIRQKGQIVAAISVAIPTFRYSDKKTEQVIGLLFTAQFRIQNLLVQMQTPFLDLI